VRFDWTQRGCLLQKVKASHSSENQYLEFSKDGLIDIGGADSVIFNGTVCVSGEAENPPPNYNGATVSNLQLSVLFSILLFTSCLCFQVF
jgi:hypothetical protein